MEQLDADNDLLNLCQVSRKFYQLATPWLYRDIYVDVSKSSHRRLLRRVSSSGSQLPRHVRSLIIDTIEWGNLQAVFDLGLALAKLVNLDDLAISGAVVFLHCILGTLYHRHHGKDLNFPDLPPTPGLPQPVH